MHPGRLLLILPHGLLFGQVIRVRLSCTHTLSSFSLHNWKVEGNWITTGRCDSLQHIHTHIRNHWFIQCFSCYSGNKKAVLKQFAKDFTLPFTAHLASAHLQWKENMKHAVRNDTCLTTLCTHGPYALKYAYTYINKHKVTSYVNQIHNGHHGKYMDNIQLYGSKAKSLRQAEFQILL